MGARAEDQLPALSRVPLWLCSLVPAIARLSWSKPLNMSAAPATSQDIGRIAAELKDRGFIRFEASRTLRLLGKGADTAWDCFASSRDDLGTDLYMADA